MRQEVLSRIHPMSVEGIELRQLIELGPEAKERFEYCFSLLGDADDFSRANRLGMQGVLFAARRWKPYYEISDWMSLEMMWVENAEEKEIVMGGMMAYDLGMGWGNRAAEVLKRIGPIFGEEIETTFKRYKAILDMVRRKYPKELGISWNDRESKRLLSLDLGLKRLGFVWSEERGYDESKLRRSI